jgi:hypothetical protein
VTSEGWAEWIRLGEESSKLRMTSASASSDPLCLGQGRGAKGMLVPGQFLVPPRNGYMKYGRSRPPSTRLVGPS